MTRVSAACRSDKQNPVLAAHLRPSFAVSSHVKREFWVCETKQSGGFSVFLFATPYSPFATPINQGSGTPTDAGTVAASFDAAPPSERPSLVEGGTEGGSPVGVPPRFSPRGLSSPKAQLQARLPKTLPERSVLYARPNRGARTLRSLSGRYPPRPRLSPARHLAHRS
jgi:hypothetical protein